jgi:zinc protease
MGWLLPTMDQAKLDVQRDIVQNERRQGVDNQPYGRANETIIAALFPPEHPYSWPVIGSLKDLSAATLDDVKNFFRKYYAPNNASIAIAGDFDAAEVKQTIEKYFSQIPRGPAIVRKTDIPAPRIAQDTFLVLEDRVQLPRLYYGWQSAKVFSADDAPLQLLGSIFGQGKTSRLYQRLVYELQVAQDVVAYQDAGRFDGQFRIVVTPKPGKTPAQMAKLIDEEIGKIVASGVTARELERAKNQLRAGYLDGIASVGGFNGKANLLNHYNFFVGDPDYIQQDLARFEAVTTADVHRVARQQFAKPKVVLTVVPEGQRELMVVAGGAR